MRLQRLELQGFKSFVDKTVLTFQPGITGVVGPNGCGKSNIVDAILWVMGEQSPKHLRGESMTDVIFNGSESRSPTSMAEVTLIMDRQGVALSPQFAAFDKGDEISITRRIFRDGSGEYLINKVICRLRDIHELFMDTGVGRRAYSIIEQGQIDRMINVKPEDRRFLFEEVAGITKYKAKRKEAEKKLELTQQNLVRIHDIIAELEKQIRSLKIQATRARKYKEIKTELEVVDLFLLGRNLSTYRETLALLEKEKAESQALRSEWDSKYSHVDAELTELEIIRIDQEKAYQELSARERDVALALQKLEGQLNLFEERRSYILQTAEANRLEEESIDQKDNELNAELDQQSQQKLAIEEELLSLERQISDFEGEWDSCQESRQRLTAREQQADHRQLQISEREIQLKKQNEFGQAKLEEILTTASTLEQRVTEALVALEVFREKLRETEARIEDCHARSQRAEQEAAALHSNCEQTSVELSEKEEALFQLRETFHTKKSRLESLTELQENLEGYSPSAQEILLRLEGHAGAAVPLAEVIQPEPGLEDHVEMLLASDMNTILMATAEEADRVALAVEEKGLERVRVAAISEMNDLPVTAEIPGAVPLLSKMRIKAGYEPAARRWLGKTYLCENVQQVLELRRQHAGFTFITASSRLMALEDGTIESGTVQSKMGVFARRREIEELTAVCAALSEQVRVASQEREQLLQRLEEQEKQRAELKDKLSLLHIESVEHRKERERAQSESHRAEREHSMHTAESERCRVQAETLQGQLAEWQREAETNAGEKEALQSEIAAIEQELQGVNSRLEQIAGSMNEKKIDKSRLSERISSIEEKIEGLTSDIELYAARRENIRAQRLKDEKERVRLETESVELKESQATLTQEKNATMIKIADTKAAFDETSTKLLDLRHEKDELQDKRNEVVAKIQEIELRLAHEQAQLEQLRSISLERYQKEPEALAEETRLALEQLPLLAAELNVTWELLLPKEQEDLLREHLKTLREKLERYGEVNLTAIQEFDEVQKRFDFLTAQKTDLDSSIKILEEAIIKIDESTKTRFSETFEAVNRKFKEIFPILFSGGKAELSLTNPENLLEAGVDVMVQPPGKRLQSISLLSGGEKALTAVSLILAIFARKPSPFCLLDEVDAPLDDANVSRFNTVIRKMAEKTQFIVITHNKKTMEIAEGLYGVTMERAGVSKMTSVSLH